jgi:hypothetical protein
MRCRSCQAEITDPQAAFCSRCGAPVGAGEAEVTEELESGERPAGASGTGVMAGDMARALRRSFVSGGWPQASSAAAVGFAATLAVGALLVITWKLAFVDFAAGASPAVVLTFIVMAGLLCLGIPIEQNGMGSSLLPLGALAVVAWALVWAGRRYVAGGPAVTAKERALEGAKLGAPLAILCFLAAAIFRLDDPDVGADPAVSLLLGAFWGALFGAIGGLTTEGRVTDLVTGRLSGMSVGSGIAREGLVAAGTMLAAASVLGMAGALLFLIGVLAIGSGVELTGGEAIAVLMVLAIFAPNLAVGAVGFSLGAPNLFVARTFDVGLAREVSLFGFGDADAAPYLYLALVIPLCACLLGGYAARRRTDHPAKPFEILAVSAAAFAISLALLVYVGTLDYAAGFLGAGSLLVLQPAVGPVFALAVIWAGAAGYAGWKVAETQERAPRRERMQREGS